ncbi:hypothetical protein [Dyella sp. M7H15-1]|uniref:hypothetical protein n=1 Tax=Dyella sp. M7H15-1 TaxID=2501295 RepID=UPI0013E8BB82|nr:hypothetical protein [Dyella sp. M7H15-1]
MNLRNALCRYADQHADDVYVAACLAFLPWGMVMAFDVSSGPVKLKEESEAMV